MRNKHRPHVGNRFNRPWRSFTDRFERRYSWEVVHDQIESGITSLRSFERDEPTHSDVKIVATLRRRLEQHRDANRESPVISFEMSKRSCDAFQMMLERNQINVDWMKSFDLVVKFYSEYDKRFQVALDRVTADSEDAAEASPALKEMEAVF